MSKYIEKTLLNILQTRLGLQDSQMGTIQPQQHLDNVKELYVYVNRIGSQSFANNALSVNTNTGKERHTIVHYISQYSIHLVSANDDVLSRRDEVIPALNSFYSRKKQAEVGITIGILSTSFSAPHEQLGSQILNRATITINVQHAIKVIEDVEYYDNSFEIELHKEI